MQDETSPIGDPQPVEPAQPGQPAQPGSFVARASGVLAISLGTTMALALFLAPRRLAGATWSAKLKWEERQRELQQVIAPPSNDSVAPAPGDSLEKREADP